MRTSAFVSLVAVLAFGLGGCAAVDFVRDNPALVVGVVVGGAAGGALGAAGSTAGHALATGAGAVAGGAVGSKLDKK